MKLVQHAFLILLEVIITFGFLTIFFFTYVSHVEEQQVKQQINNVVVDLVNELKTLLVVVPNQDTVRQNLIDNIRQKLEALPKPKPSTKNILLQSRGLLYLGIFFIAITAISLGMSFTKTKFEWQDILHYAILAVIVAAIVEFLFLRFIATKYISVDGSTILNMLGKQLQ